jgi:hemerythrin-like metal-binding protein
MDKKILWSQEYSVNVADLDAQHKEWINICNNLIDLAGSDSFTKEEALMRVARLGDYAHYHFSTEEKLFDETKYPDAVAHVEAHNQFRKKAESFIDQIRDENIDAKETIKEIAEFTIDWLLKHILVVDKKYSEFFNQHGVK